MINTNYSMTTNNSYRNISGQQASSVNFTGLFGNKKIIKNLSEELRVISEALNQAKINIAEQAKKLSEALNEIIRLKQDAAYIKQEAAEASKKWSFFENLAKERYNLIETLKKQHINEVEDLKQQHLIEIEKLTTQHAKKFAPYTALEQMKLTEGEITPGAYIDACGNLYKNLPETKKAILAYLDNPNDTVALNRITDHVNGLNIINEGNKQGTRDIVLKDTPDMQVWLEKIAPSHVDPRYNFYDIGAEAISDSVMVKNIPHRERLAGNLVNLGCYYKFDETGKGFDTTKNIVLDDIMHILRVRNSAV